MRKLFILSLAIAVCWAKPDVSHLTNNGYLPPLQPNAYEAPTQGKSSTAEYAPVGGSSIPLQQSPSYPKPRRAQIESIQPSIHIASFSVRTTVPLQQSYSQTQQARSSYYAPQATPASSVPPEDYYRHNAPAAYQENLTQQSYAAPASTQQTYSPTAPATSPLPRQQSYPAPVPIPFAAPQTYFPPKHMQHYNAPPNVVQQTEAVHPAAVQYNYVPPTPAQRSYEVPKAAPNGYVSQPQPSQQSYTPTSPPQQTYLPPTVYTPPAPVQQAYVPPASETVQQAAPQFHSPPAPEQQSFTPPEQVQQSYVPPAPIQQSYAPATPVQQNVAQAPVQQSYSPPAPVQQSYSPADFVPQTYAPTQTDQDSFVPSPPAQQSYATPTFDAASAPAAYLPPLLDQQAYERYSSNQGPHSSQTTSQHAYTAPAGAQHTSLQTQQNYSPIFTPQQAQPYMPPMPAQASSPTQQSYSPPATTQQEYKSPAPPQQTYLPPNAPPQRPNQVQQSYPTAPAPEPVQQTYSASPAPQQFYSAPQHVQHNPPTTHVEPEIKQAEPERPSSPVRPEGEHNYGPPSLQSAQQFVPTQEPHSTPEMHTTRSSARDNYQAQQVTESSPGSYNYNAPKQISEPRPSTTSHESSSYYNPQSRTQPTAPAAAPAQLTYSNEGSSTATYAGSYSYNGATENSPAPAPTAAVQAQSPQSSATQNYSPQQAMSSAGAYNYEATDVQQDQPIESGTPPVSTNHQDSPASSEMFNFIPASISQPQRDYSYMAPSDTQSNQASIQSRESTKLTAVQPAAQTASFSNSKTEQFAESVGTEYGANGGYVYRRN